LRDSVGLECGEKRFEREEVDVLPPLRSSSARRATSATPPAESIWRPLACAFVIHACGDPGFGGRAGCGGGPRCQGLPGTGSSGASGAATQPCASDHARATRRAFFHRTRERKCEVCGGAPAGKPKAELEQPIEGAVARPARTGQPDQARDCRGWRGRAGADSLRTFPEVCLRFERFSDDAVHPILHLLFHTPAFRGLVSSLASASGSAGQLRLLFGWLQIAHRPGSTGIFFYAERRPPGACAAVSAQASAQSEGTASTRAVERLFVVTDQRLGLPFMSHREAPSR
jgi:hypothetical protein